MYEISDQKIVFQSQWPKLSSYESSIVTIPQNKHMKRCQHEQKT